MERRLRHRLGADLSGTADRGLGRGYLTLRDGHRGAAGARRHHHYHQHRFHQWFHKTLFIGGVHHQPLDTMNRGHWHIAGRALHDCNRFSPRNAEQGVCRGEIQRRRPRQSATSGVVLARTSHAAEAPHARRVETEERAYPRRPRAPGGAGGSGHGARTFPALLFYCAAMGIRSKADLDALIAAGCVARGGGMRGSASRSARIGVEFSLVGVA